MLGIMIQAMNMQVSSRCTVSKNVTDFDGNRRSLCRTGLYLGLLFVYLGSAVAPAE